MTPKRIRRERTKGWRMPEGAVYVGRPSKWGNPFIDGDQSRGLVRFGPKHLERVVTRWFPTTFAALCVLVASLVVLVGGVLLADRAGWLDRIPEWALVVGLTALSVVGAVTTTAVDDRVKRRRGADRG